MTTEDELLLGLLRFGFWNRWDSTLPEKINWEELLAKAKYHKLIPFIYDAICRLQIEQPQRNFSISDEMLIVMKQYSIRTVIRNADLIRYQKEIVSAFEEKRIQGCILKGTSLMVDYPKPNLRALGDLDIYVRPEAFSDAGDVLKNMGFEYLKSTTLYHAAYVKGGFEVELHNSLAGLPLGKTRSKMFFLKDMCERGVEGDINYGNNLVPCDLDCALVQLLHILHHTAGKGLTFRLLCDWMMFVNKHLTDKEWEESFKAIFDSLGLTQAAMLITKICQDYLGLDNPEVTWCQKITKEEYASYFTYVLTNGNLANQKKKGGSAKDLEIQEDIWERKSQKKGNYAMAALFRNIALIVCGKRTIRQCFSIWNNRNATKNKLLELNLMTKSFAKDYAL